MPVINHVKREINAKIVYVGPPGGGKKTSLGLVHARLRPECRSAVRRQGAGLGELLFFDFLPREIGSVDGYHVRFHLYAVAADGSDDSTLRMVLKGGDGIMFVADAGPGRGEANRLALEQVEEILHSFGVDVTAFPLVVQLNKSDLLAGDESASALFTGKGIDVQPSDARQGEGVLAAVSMLVKKVMAEIRRSGVQVQEPEVIPEESAGLTGDGADAVAEPAPVTAGVRWQLTAAAAELTEQSGNLSLPLLLTGSDGRNCRLTITVAVSEEVE